jgi:integrase
MAKVIKNAEIRQRQGKRGITFIVDHYTPEGLRKKRHFKHYKDADDYLAKIKVAKREGRYQEIFDVKEEKLTTFNELADRYIENYRDQKSFSRLKYYLLAEYRAIFGPKKLSEITFYELEAFRNRRKKTPTRAGKLRRDATVNREMSTLRHMLNKAVEWNLLAANPLHEGSKLFFKEGDGRRRFLSNKEIEKLLEAAGSHLRPILEVALLTGMRREELLSLKWEQIRHGLIYLTETKSGRGRQIPINERLAEVLQEIRSRQQLRSPYVLTGPQGERIRECKRAFLTACRRAGIEGFRFHDLRHTFASHLVMKGASLKAVQELLGHRDLKMVMRYAHVNPGHLQEAVDLLRDLTDSPKIVPKRKKVVGTGGFEPPTSCSQGRHANQAALRPDDRVSGG